MGLLLLLQACPTNPASIQKKTSEKNSDSLSKLPKTQSSAPRIKRRWSDVHTHLSPYTIETFVKVMDDNAIARAVNMSGGATSERRSQTLQATQGVEDRIFHFMNVDWRGVDETDFGEKAAAQLREAVMEQGFSGLKISKALGLGVKLKDGSLLKIDDRRLDPLWKEAGKLGVIVAIHTSDPKAFFEEITKDNERYAELSIAPSWSFYGDAFPSREALLNARNRVIERHPQTTFMALHFANNPEDLDAVAGWLRTYPNLIVDVAARLAEIGRHDPAAVKKVFEEFQDRILFATDIQVGVQPYQGNLYLRVTLGSVSKTPPKIEDIIPFYQKHAAFFETDKADLVHPIPIQGEWNIHGIGLGEKIQEKVYLQNGEKYIFAPSLARRIAVHVAGKANTTP